MTGSRQHPTISDVALALATRNRSESLTKVTLSDANAKGIVQVTVDVTDPDPKKAATTALNLYATCRAEHPRENGGES